MADTWIEFFKWIMIVCTPCAFGFAAYIKWLAHKIDVEKIKAKENALSSMQVYDILTNYYQIRDKLKEMELNYEMQEFKSEQIQLLIAEIKQSVAKFQEGMLEFLTDGSRRHELPRH